MALSNLNRHDDRGWKLLRDIRDVPLTSADVRVFRFTEIDNGSPDVNVWFPPINADDGTFYFLKGDVDGHVGLGASLEDILYECKDPACCSELSLEEGMPYIQTLLEYFRVREPIDKTLPTLPRNHFEGLERLTAYFGAKPNRDLKELA